MHTSLQDILSGPAIGRRIVDGIVRRILENPADFHTLSLLTADPDEKTARRAWWVCEKLSYLAPEYFDGKHEGLKQLVVTTSDEGVRRIVLNMLLFLPLPTEGGSEAIDVAFLDYCLEQMCAPQRSASVQALLLKHAYGMCKQEPELLQEFSCILDNTETDYYTPAVTSTIRNIQKKIRKRKIKERIQNTTNHV